jgi:hypothetical protein
MSGRSEATRRKVRQNLPPEGTLRDVWWNRHSLAEQTQRVIDEATAEISRSIRKEFERPK